VGSGTEEGLGLGSEVWREHLSEYRGGDVYVAGTNAGKHLLPSRGGGLCAQGRPKDQVPDKEKRTEDRANSNRSYQDKGKGKTRLTRDWGGRGGDGNYHLMVRSGLSGQVRGEGR